MVPHVLLDEVVLQLKLHRRQTPANLKDVLLRRLQRSAAPPNAPTTFRALDDITLSLAAGERLGVIGRNGAGKSTLLRVMSKIYRPSSGRVEIHGFLVPLLQSDVGFCNELTARENILQAGAILGIAQREMEARVDEILDFADIADFADTPTKYLSRGMLARLSFSTATTASPEILVLDEALSGGDLAFRDKAQRRLEDLISRTSIVVMASHAMPTVRQLCTRVVWIDRGKIVLDGKPNDVVDAYQQGVQETRHRKSA